MALMELVRRIARRRRESAEARQQVPLTMLSDREAHELLEDITQRRFGMTPHEFREALEHGKFEHVDTAQAAEVAALLPLGR